MPYINPGRVGELANRQNVRASASAESLFVEWDGSNDVTVDTSINTLNGGYAIADRIDDNRMIVGYRNTSGYPCVVVINIANDGTVTTGTPAQAIAASHEVYDVKVLSATKAVLICAGRMFVATIGSGTTVSTGAEQTGAGYDLGTKCRATRVSDTLLACSSTASNALRVGLYSINGTTLNVEDYYNTTSTYTSVASCVTIMNEDSETNGNILLRNTASSNALARIPFSIAGGTTLTVDEGSANIPFRVGSYTGITTPVLGEPNGPLIGFKRSGLMGYGISANLDGLILPLVGFINESNGYPHSTIRINPRTATNQMFMLGESSTNEFHADLFGSDSLLFIDTVNDASKFNYGMIVDGLPRSHQAALPSGNIESVCALGLRDNLGVFVCPRTSAASMLLRLVKP